MALVHQISARASVDLDFSLKQDFGDDVAGAEARIHKALTETFRASGYEVFDFRMIEKPRAISEDNLSIQLMTTINAILATRGLTPKTSTVVDATLIGAPSSTKNSTASGTPDGGALSRSHLFSAWD